MHAANEVFGHCLIIVHYLDVFVLCLVIACALFGHCHCALFGHCLYIVWWWSSIVQPSCPRRRPTETKASRSRCSPTSRAATPREITVSPRRSALCTTPSRVLGWRKRLTLNLGGASRRTTFRIFFVNNL